MAERLITKANVWEDSDCVCMARVVGIDGDEITQADRDKAAEGMRSAAEALRSGKYRIVVLDEVSVAIKFGLVRTDEVVRAIRERGPGVEAVVTGRYAPRELLDMADYVTELRAVKHPYQKGITSRKGVDR